MSVSFLKHYYNFSITFNLILRSISGTGKVDSVVILKSLNDSQRSSEIQTVVVPCFGQ